jgi:DNA-binding beta-propeller fold protein YncE
MRMAIARLAALGALALALGAGAAPAQGAAGDPLFVFVPVPPPPPAKLTPPPTGRFNGPCGLAVDSHANFYVSDYYHGVIDRFTPDRIYTGGFDGGDPLDGPCQIAFDSTDRLYVNDYHREVAGLDDEEPTGVAVDTATDHVYVDRRTSIAVYDSSGNPVLDAGLPLEVGLGSLGEGYGVAVSQFPATAGRLYVPDAADDTVKVYDPALDKVNPLATIPGPGSGFNSLRDAAIAVDRVTGNLYVADNLQPVFTERPEAVIDVFDPTGAFLGRLRYRVVDALPPGLAVDNSAQPTQGRVYLTSGNTDQAAVYAYPPGAQVPNTLPSAQSLAVSATGNGGGQIASDLGELQCTGTCEVQIRSGAEVTLRAEADPGSAFAGWSGAGCSGSGACTIAMDEAASVSAHFQSTAGPPKPRAPASDATITQKGALRLSVAGRISPQKLPRAKSAPIAVTVGWKLATTDESPVPKLKTLGIEINRHGRFDYRGLPTCPYAKIQPATSSRALANCRSALVGTGTFNAEIALKEQERYDARGRLLVFNGLSHGKPVLFGQIYSPHPFASSFVIVFSLKTLGKGTYGTALAAKLPKALASWGNLTGIQMRLARRYSYEGHSHSYISAGCPAPKGFTEAVFPLARASFEFQGAAKLASTLTSTCQARG